MKEKYVLESMASKIGPLKTLIKPANIQRELIRNSENWLKTCTAQKGKTDL